MTFGLWRRWSINQPCFPRPQEEIRRLHEANRAASDERKRLLQQHEEIARIKERTQVTMGRVRGEVKARGKGRLERPQEVHTEDEVEDAEDTR